MKYFANVRIDALPKSENALRGRSFWILVNEKKLWHRRLAFGFLGLIPIKPLSQARIVLTRHSCKTSDLDNLLGSFKIILDIMKAPTNGQNKHRLSIIEDDSPDKVLVEYRQEKAKRGAGYITISIEGEIDG